MDGRGSLPPDGGVPGRGGPALAAIAWRRPFWVSPRRCPVERFCDATLLRRSRGGGRCGSPPGGGESGNPPGSLGRGALRSWYPLELGAVCSEAWCHAPRVASGLSAPSGPPGHLPLRGRTREKHRRSQMTGRGGSSPDRRRSRTRHDTRRGEYGNPPGSLGGGRSGPGVSWSLGASDGAGWCHAPRAASGLSAPSG